MEQPGFFVKPNDLFGAGAGRTARRFSGAAGRPSRWQAESTKIHPHDERLWGVSNCQGICGGGGAGIVWQAKNFLAFLQL